MSVTFTSFGQPPLVIGDINVGPYTMALPGVPSIDVFCVDFINDVYVPQTYDAFISPLDGSLANTRKGDAGIDLYRRAAWLTTQFASHAQSEWGAIHAAIWYITSPDPENDPYAYGLLKQAGWHSRFEVGSTGVQDWIDAADANYQNVDLKKFAIITDVNAVGVTGYQGVQEYMVITPEPVTMLLVGTGLVGTMAADRRRRRRGRFEPETKEVA